MIGSAIRAAPPRPTSSREEPRCPRGGRAASVRTPFAPVPTNAPPRCRRSSADCSTSPRGSAEPALCAIADRRQPVAAASPFRSCGRPPPCLGRETAELGDDLGRLAPERPALGLQPPQHPDYPAGWLVAEEAGHDTVIEELSRFIALPPRISIKPLFRRELGQLAGQGFFASLASILAIGGTFNA